MNVLDNIYSYPVLLLFQSRLFEPCNVHVVGMLEILIKHINRHYTCNIASLPSGQIRRKIFRLLLSLRADENHFMGMADGDQQSSIRYFFERGIVLRLIINKI